MDTKILRDRDVIDLESGTKTIISEQDGSKDAATGIGEEKTMLVKVWNGFTGEDGCLKGKEVLHSTNFTSSSSEDLTNGEALVERRFKGEEGKVETDKPKKKRFKKPPRPPRPPNPLPLDAADQKLVHEISELAMLKRARIERMKALKKMKNSKSTSSNSNLCALIVTVLFCLVIIWQGVFSKNTSSLRFHGSPESSIGTNGGLISVQFYKNVSTISPRGSSSSSANNMEPVPGVGVNGETSRAAG
ncbi:uncharacterized protein [Typha angustifolia]|uniref:uncharacterized protein isoform X1 n=1 Tax=Typha angustifolia TaxID=59011 RepID=UPI003C30C9DB